MGECNDCNDYLWLISFFGLAREEHYTRGSRKEAGFNMAGIFIAQHLTLPIRSFLQWSQVPCGDEVRQRDKAVSIVGQGLEHWCDGLLTPFLLVLVRKVVVGAASSPTGKGP